MIDIKNPNNPLAQLVAIHNCHESQKFQNLPMHAYFTCCILLVNSRTSDSRRIVQSTKYKVVT